MHEIPFAVVARGDIKARHVGRRSAYSRAPSVIPGPVGIQEGFDDVITERRWEEAVAIRAEIRRYVERAERGDLLAYHEDRAEPEDIDWGRIVGYARRAERRRRTHRPRSSTGATAQGGVSVITANEQSGSSTRNDWQKDDKIVPKANPEVARIMVEQGVGRRTAYELLRKQLAREIDVTGVGQSQRMAVLSALINDPKPGRDAKDLLEALHREHIKIDLHDVNKTLWALQKNGDVRFRQRYNPNGLYAIRVTAGGLATFTGMSEAHVEAARVATDLLTEHDAEMERNLAVAERARKAQAAIDAIIEEPEREKVEITERLVAYAEPLPEPEEQTEFRPTSRLSFGDFSGWPQFKTIRDRARKEAKIEEAIKLLEEVGESEVALTLMVKNDFTELELEVKHLLELMGEL